MMKFRRSGQSRANEPPSRPAAALFAAGALPRADRLHAANQTQPSTVTGVAPWFRCFAEQATEPVASIASAGDRPWRVYTAGCETLRREVFDLFRPEPAADRTVAVLGRLNERGAVEAAVLAAQDAISTGELVAVSDDPAWTGLWASLHAEHPATGITAVRTRLDQAGLRAASGIGAVPGQYRELTVDTGGLVRELVARPAAIKRAGPFPLSQDDVVLISRSTGPAGLALAQVLACSGAGVAVVGRDHPGRDDVLIAALEKLRQAGAPIGYEIVNPASATALDAAVRRIERRLGPVTALAQAVRTTPPRALASLDPADVRAEVADQARLLDQLVTAAGPLKLIITFGSIAGRYGLAENATAALATSALADHAERIAAASPGCHMLHVDWPEWSGTAQIPIAEGSRLLLNLLAATNRPARLAIHGRLGLRPPRPIAVAGQADAAQAGRFAERVLVHYPGVELITEAVLDARTDPYLADYVIDGACLLPPAIAFEAMAQAASVLAGAPMRSAAEVSMTAPVVLPGREPAAVLRLCALAADDGITVIVRCDSTGFAVDHFRATFPTDFPTEPKQVSQVPAAGVQHATRWPAPSST